MANSNVWVHVQVTSGNKGIGFAIVHGSSMVMSYYLVSTLDVPLLGDPQGRSREREIGSGPVGGHFEKRTRDVSP